jgi:15-cis-phytoene synthase
MSESDDFVACAEILARGSKSFALASRLLPARLRAPVAAFYAFCRVSDDAVDESAEPKVELERLSQRLDAIYAGSPHDEAVDRALARVVASHDLPRAPLDALLDGYAWDALGREYRTLSDVIAYSARVASSVGVAMTVLMGVRERRVLARAADLGVAMQLVNIARDVGEDARRGRVYLPSQWLESEGLSASTLLADPVHSSGLGRVVERLLEQADVLTRRALPAVLELPSDCRWAVGAAGRIYADIGRVIREANCDTVSARAYTKGSRKLWLATRAGASLWVPRAELWSDEPLPEVEFLLPRT